jgi:hypothetical protein
MTPEMSITSPKATRYTNLNSRPGMKSRFFVRISVRKVERGSLAALICGHVIQSVARSATVPIKHRSKLRA